MELNGELNRCQFEPLPSNAGGPGLLRCKICGATVSSSRPRAQVHRRCSPHLAPDDSSGASARRRFRTPAEDARCAHRGELLRIARCNVCGGNGQPFDVFACAVKGECSLKVRRTDMPHCVACRDWIDSVTHSVSAASGSESS